MKLWDYLIQHNKESTAERYYSIINVYIESIGKREARNAKYQEIINYIGKLRKHYEKPETVKCHLAGIKKYYKYLAHIGFRKDNPSRNIVIKDKKRPLQLQDLFTLPELELLLERKERYKILEIKNKMVMSLLVYQALPAISIQYLQLKDIDLDKAEIHIKVTTNTTERTLQLKPHQITLISKYLSEVRPKLIGRRKSNAFVLTKKGTTQKKDDTHYLVSTYQHLFPDRKLTPTSIRQSVIYNLLKEGKDLRIVQVFSGIKNLCSVEVYRQKDIEELQNEINKYHPLG